MDLIFIGFLSTDLVPFPDPDSVRDPGLSKMRQISVSSIFFIIFNDYFGTAEKFRP